MSKDKSKSGSSTDTTKTSSPSSAEDFAEMRPSNTIPGRIVTHSAIGFKTPNNGSKKISRHENVLHHKDD